MNLNNLSDNELIDYVIKHDNDPIRVRLATHMQRLGGAVIDDLIDAGMDNTWFNFTSTVNGSDYHPGQYISHLENEIDYLNEKLKEAHDSIKNLQARTIMDVMNELRQEIKSIEWSRDEARKERNEAKERESIMKNKLDMWAILNR